jgi:SET domain-containing protein
LENIVIKTAANKGQGVFSLVNVPTNHIIFKFIGTPIKKEDIKDFSGKIASCYLQIGTDLYLNVEGDASYFVNHSCNPNTAVRIHTNQAFLISIRPIVIGEEIVFDYSTTSTEDVSTWSMGCNCSRFECRKVITGFYSLTAAQQKVYIDKEMVPKYVSTT